MPSELEGIYDPQTGEHVGFSTWNDGGQQILTDPNGIVQNVLEDGEDIGVPAGYYQLDLSAPSGVAELQADTYEDQDDGSYADERFAELDARLSAQEQKVDRPQVLLPADPITYDSGRISAEMEAQTAQLEAMMGRRLTLDERRDIGQEVVDTVARGRPVDVEDAASRLAIEDRGGIRHGSLDNDQERHDYYASRLRDEDRLANQERRGDDLSTPLPPPDKVEFNLENDQERQTYMTQRALGQEAYAVEPAEDS